MMKFRYYVYNILEKTVLGEVGDLEEGKFVIDGLNAKRTNYILLRKSC